MQRIWKRNLGRDDRCIADNGKEVVLMAFSLGLAPGFAFHLNSLLCFLLG